jgi:hypothetical protein
MRQAKYLDRIKGQVFPIAPCCEKERGKSRPDGANLIRWRKWPSHVHAALTVDRVLR